LQNASRDSDACPSRPENVREKFLSQGNAGTAESVLTHQQPSRQSLFNFIHPIARGNLRGLHHHGLREAI
jgi:hypothetical protein